MDSFQALKGSTTRMMRISVVQRALVEVPVERPADLIGEERIPTSVSLLLVTSKPKHLRDGTLPLSASPSEVASSEPRAWSVGLASPSHRPLH